MKIFNHVPAPTVTEGNHILSLKPFPSPGESHLHIPFREDTRALRLPTEMGEEQTRISRRGQTRGRIHPLDSKVLFLRQLLGQNGHHAFRLTPLIPNGNGSRTLYPNSQSEIDTLSMKGPLLAIHDFPNHLQDHLLIKRL